MCWSATVSLNTFIFSLFGMLFALANGVLSFERSLYIFSFISMQLVEYFAWKNLDNKKVIRLLSQIGTLVVISQVVFAVNQDKKLPNKTLLYLLFASVTFLFFTTSKIDYSMHKAPNGHLAWKWLSSWPKWYLLFWVACILGLALHMKEYDTFVIALVTISISYYTYSSSGTWGSMWCWIANILAFWWVAKVFYKDLCY
jgi:hypothetical protein